MTDAEKKAQLKNKQSNLKSDAKSHENSINDLDAKIKKLKNAYNNLEKCKKEMEKSVKKPDQKICDARYKWKGNWYSNDFKRDMHKMLDAEKQYIKSVGLKMDNINKKINELNNERKRHLGILGQIKAQLDNIGRDLQNLVN